MSGIIYTFVVTMSKRIIDDAVQLLKDAGWQPMVCDTAVPYFDNGVPAGIPQDLGEYSGESVMLPKEVMEYEPMIMIRGRGESMCGAGIENGDMVTLLLDTNVEDGDIVVAWLDGEATLKVFYRDEAGEAWLVPQNEKYQPIRLRDFTNVWILGKVVDVKKHLPRVPFRHIQQYMKNVKREQGESPDDANLTLRIALLQDAINRLVEYDPELVEVSEAIKPLEKLNAITVDELKSDLNKMTNDITTARNQLVL